MQTLRDQIREILIRGPITLDDCRVIESEFVRACQVALASTEQRELNEATVEVQKWLGWFPLRVHILRMEAKKAELSTMLERVVVQYQHPRNRE